MNINVNFDGEVKFVEKQNSHHEEEIVTEETENLEQEVEEGQDSEVIEPEMNEETELESLQKQVDELENKYLRTQAEYDNFRRRTREERSADAKYRSQKLAEELLPAIDNFERALAVQSDHEEVNSLLTGMEMVYRQLKDALVKEGIEEVGSQGEEFNPHLHQAVMQVESDEYDSDVIVEVLQKGYKLNDRVLRPAMVKVSS
ncbi:nucleotide exchange factor GrpE [Guptibacillus algicola]|uniref:nucleotide exchange factor GrpE n=1 Tax=Guptibacillus algicola TaxID=225844 RepID=UPI001CD3D1CC|nr:nucleotide exchange factor GrpE [Alkalihalobacillus algicola]MCA0986102.1 nucleotide exchange factor GrpE [Alkalihalobacillus algicola]